MLKSQAVGALISSDFTCGGRHSAVVLALFLSSLFTLTLQYDLCRYRSSLLTMLPDVQRVIKCARESNYTPITTRRRIKCVTKNHEEPGFYIRIDSVFSAK
jgi:hypothetical protein